MVGNRYRTFGFSKEVFSILLDDFSGPVPRVPAAAVCRVPDQSAATSEVVSGLPAMTQLVDACKCVDRMASAVPSSDARQRAARFSVRSALVA